MHKPALRGVVVVITGQRVVVVSGVAARAVVGARGWYAGNHTDQDPHDGSQHELLQGLVRVHGVHLHFSVCRSGKVDRDPCLTEEGALFGRDEIAAHCQVDVDGLEGEGEAE